MSVSPAPGHAPPDPRTLADDYVDSRALPAPVEPARRLVDRLYWVWCAAATIVCFPSFDALTFWLPARRRRVAFGRLMRLWGRLLVLGHPVRIEGAERIPRGEPVIFASNHQSTFDIPLIYAVFPVVFRWLCKHDLFEKAFVGLALRRTGSISVHRGDRRKAARSLLLAAEALAGGDSVLVFPEGTWGDHEGRMRPFKAGIHSLAVKSGARVVPLTIVGSHRVNPSWTRKVQRGPMRVIVHAPLAVDPEVDAATWLAELRAIIGGPLPHGTAMAEPRPEAQPLAAI